MPEGMEERREEEIKERRSDEEGVEGREEIDMEEMNA